MSGEIKIQDDYWVGDKCLENGVPWVVPGAVHLLAKLMGPDDRVLDIGSGGSTVFYAQRCLEVTAVETNPAWHKLVKAELSIRGITNVGHYVASAQAAVEGFLKGLPGGAFGSYDVVSVDSVHGYSRSRFLDLVAGKCQRVLVLDNYAAPELFERHHGMTWDEVATQLPGEGWRSETFDDPHWCGKGTRVIYRD